MKRFMDYQPTKAELLNIFGDEKPEWAFEEYNKDPGGDIEKRGIALLLFVRGQREGCLNILESIEDDEYRWECLHEQLPLWGKWKRGAM